MKTRYVSAFAGLSLCLLAGAAMAGSGEELIALDKKWGEAGTAGDTDTVATVLADDLIAVGEDGVGGKAEVLADNEPAPEGTSYEAGDYNVTYLDDNTALMTHSGAGDEPYYSLHVWARRDGDWKVVATASVPAASE